MPPKPTPAPTVVSVLQEVRDALLLIANKLTPKPEEPTPSGVGAELYVDSVINQTGFDIHSTISSDFGMVYWMVADNGVLLASGQAILGGAATNGACFVSCPQITNTSAIVLTRRGQP